MQTQLSRRSFLCITGYSSALAALAACNPAKPLGATAGKGGVSAPPIQTEDDYLLHLLRRTTAGPAPSDVERALSMGADGWLEEQLSAAAQDHPAVTPRLSGFETLDLSPPELAALQENGRVVGELIAATLIRQVYSPNQLYEQMVDFWTNHFNVHVRSAPVFLLKGADDREVIRPHALGRFPNLLRASTHSPAMLAYLDNATSQTPSPNENYARELLELHSLGVDGGYTQADVEAVARAFTGWSVRGPRERDGGAFVFRAPWHDNGPKTVLGVALPNTGKGDGDRVLDLLAEHPSTAHFIAYKLCRRFVSDIPPHSIVERVAQTYLQTDGDIPDMLRTIFHSDEFAASAGVKLKRPLDYFVSILRVLQADGTPVRRLFEQLVLLGQVPYSWPSPDGYPDYAAAWGNTSQMLNRWSLALLLTSGGIPGLRTEIPVYGQDMTTAEQIGRLAQHFLGRSLPEEATSILLDFAVEAGAPGLSSALAGLILSSPYFQVR